MSQRSAYAQFYLPAAGRLKVRRALCPGGGSPGSQPIGAQPSGKPGGATYVTASALPNQFTTATITDPSLNNMPSATLTIPAGWQL